MDDDVDLPTVLLSSHLGISQNSFLTPVGALTKHHGEESRPSGFRQKLWSRKRVWCVFSEIRYFKAENTEGVFHDKHASPFVVTFALPA